ncbi:MAG: DUF2235 domain-containing protein [Alphaproteobacteria bacterium]|nr:DUF2235 domain-containing protein [Alphaproteobacteria bacterium]
MAGALNKKLVLCLDGTYNEPLRIWKSTSIPYEARSWTNVAKIAFLIDERGKIGSKHVNQVTNYIQGVRKRAKKTKRESASNMPNTRVWIGMLDKNSSPCAIPSSLSSPSPVAKAPTHSIEIRTISATLFKCRGGIPPPFAQR